MTGNSVIDWDKLVETHGPLVVRICWRILGHAHDVEETVQDVFLKAYQLQQRQPIRHWPALLRRVAAYSAIERLRRRSKTVSLAESFPSPAAADPHGELVCREAEEQFRSALGKLPQRESAAFCLRYFDGLSNTEIAESLNINYAAAAAAVSRARSRLAAVLLTPTTNSDGA